MNPDTQRESASESTPNFPGAQPGSNAETRRARGAQARARAALKLVTPRNRETGPAGTVAPAGRTATGGLRTVRSAGSSKAKPGPAVRGGKGAGSPWTEWPVSLADLHAHVTHPEATWHGDVPAVEAAGLAYHYLIALPVTAVLYAAAWVLQRPARLLALILIGLLVWAGLTL